MKSKMKDKKKNRSGAKAGEKNRSQASKGGVPFDGYDPGALYFIPLGGSEEFGVNLNVYGTQGKWLVADFGIGFADHRYPGVDILLPDPGFLTACKKEIEALIITHAHEDHIGAVPYLWTRLRCPIYCTPFTAAVLRNKFKEREECAEAEIHVVEAGDILRCGPFKVEFVPVAHSIPDTCALIIETKQGRVVHSADWNMDPAPVIGLKTEALPFQKAGKKGVLAYIGDSTNAEVPGRAGSESDVRPGLEALMRESGGRVAVTTFSSNIGRLKSIALAAAACGRSTALAGRSLHKMVGAAHECGLLEGVPDFIGEEEAAQLPADKVVLICTGSQGEARAMLPRIARGDHPHIRLGKGDRVIFSSRAIPGNEKDIIALKNTLVAAGVEVISPRDTAHTIHVSGHGCRDEIADMLGWVQPELVIPVHGERSMIEAQAKLALSCQIKQALVPNNGVVIHLKKGGGSAIVGHVETGLLAVEPGRVVSADHPSLAERRKLQFSGSLHVSLVMSANGDLLADPQISTAGLVDEQDGPGQDFLEGVLDEIDGILSDLTYEELEDDHFVREELRIGLRRYVYNLIRIKPKTSVHLVRLPDMAAG